jgi:hypothetical protein
LWFHLVLGSWIWKGPYLQVSGKPHLWTSLLKMSLGLLSGVSATLKKLCHTGFCTGISEQAGMPSGAGCACGGRDVPCGSLGVAGSSMCLLTWIVLLYHIGPSRSAYTCEFKLQKGKAGWHSRKCMNFTIRIEAQFCFFHL